MHQDKTPEKEEMAILFQRKTRWTKLDLKDELAGRQVPRHVKGSTENSEINLKKKKITAGEKNVFFCSTRNGFFFSKEWDKKIY